MLEEKDIKLIERMISESIASVVSQVKEKDYLAKDVLVTNTESKAQEKSTSRMDAYGKILGKRDGEKRKAKVIFALSGGKAAKGSQTTRITLPITWVREMGITPEEREVNISFKDGKIIIEKAKETKEEQS